MPAPLLPLGLLPLSVLSLNITGSVTDGSAEVNTNRTWVVPLGTPGLILSCDSDKGVWYYQNGSVVPGAEQGAGHAVHQVVTNGSGGVLSKDLVFTGGFSEGVQGFYQCTQPRGGSAYVAVFLDGGLGEWGRTGKRRGEERRGGKRRGEGGGKRRGEEGWDYMAVIIRAVSSFNYIVANTYHCCPFIIFCGSFVWQDNELLTLAPPLPSPLLPSHPILFVHLCSPSQSQNCPGVVPHCPSDVGPA